MERTNHVKAKGKRVSDLFNRIKVLYSRLNLKKKMIINFIAVILTIVVFVSSFYYYRSVEIIKNNASRQFVQLMEQTQINMDNMLTGIEEISRFYSSNESLLKILQKADNGYPLGEQIDDYTLLMKICNANTNKNIAKVKIYFHSNAIYTRENNNFFPLSAITGKEYYNRIDFAKGAPIWVYDPESLSVSCIRDVIDYRYSMEKLGVIEIVLNAESVLDIFGSLTSYTKGAITLIDDTDREVVLKADPDNNSHTLLETFHGISHEESSVTRKEDNMISSRQLTNNWYIISSFPLSYFNNNFASVTVDIVFLCIISFFLAFALSSLLSRSLSNRIVRIVAFLQNIDIRREDHLTEKYKDEITVVETNINRMLDTIRQYIRENGRINRQKKEADLSVLQQQINPHFLYNCLDTINWMAMTVHADEISNISQLLGRYFRLILSKGAQFIPIKDELEHVAIYCEIMQIRFDGSIHVHYDVDPSLSDKKILKILLQPLVENAILHGISEKPSQEGNIDIHISQEKKDILFSVADDGIGILEEQLEELRSRINTDSDSDGNHGIGLRNVNQRILLYYGPEHGIHIESEFGKGTRITFTLPCK